MKNIEVVKVALEAKMVVIAEFQGGVKMRVNSFLEDGSRVIGQFVSGPLELIYEDELRSCPVGCIVACNIIF